VPIADTNQICKATGLETSPSTHRRSLNPVQLGDLVLPEGARIGTLIGKGIKVSAKLSTLPAKLADRTRPVRVRAGSIPAMPDADVERLGSRNLLNRR
jgi:hypothetical protein